jgi:RNA polymerase sigma-70 factor (ECF subfamily)
MESVHSMIEPATGSEEAVDIDAGRAVAPLFTDFYRETRPAVYRTVLLATRSPERADDAVQEAYTKALAAWPHVAAHPNPVAWVARVALNQATSWWRVRGRELPNPPDRPAAPDERPMDEAITRLVWALPRRQRQVVAVRILLDQSTDETARLLGLSPGTVKTHLHRGLSSLRKALNAAGHMESIG